MLRDTALYRQTHYNWTEPNGEISEASLQADADLFRELGVASAPIDLSEMFDPKYRQFAVQYLGEYRPPH